MRTRTTDSTKILRAASLGMVGLAALLFLALDDRGSAVAWTALGFALVAAPGALLGWGARRLWLGIRRRPAGTA